MRKSSRKKEESRKLCSNSRGPYTCTPYVEKGISGSLRILDLQHLSVIVTFCTCLEAGQWQYMILGQKSKTVNCPLPTHWNAFCKYQSLILVILLHFQKIKKKKDSVNSIHLRIKFSQLQIFFIHVFETETLHKSSRRQITLTNTSWFF